MLFKKLIFLLMLAFFYVNVQASCVYLEDHSSCDFVTSQGLNEFNIDTSNLGDFDYIEVSLISPLNERIPLNELSSTRNVFYQSKVFPMQGVYDLEVEAILVDGISKVSKTYSVLYIDSNPLPPVIEDVTQLSSPADTIRLQGFINNYLSGDEVLVYNNENLITTQLLTSSSFDITIPLSDLNKIELLVNRPTLNVKSSKIRFLFYKDSDELEFDTLATINSVDFQDEESIILSSTSSKIVTQSPYYYISGTASGGNVVYIQGVPTPVIGGEFEAFLFLNEGVDEICVYGNNSRCMTYETIYSYKNSLYNVVYDLKESSISFTDENFNKLSDLSLNKDSIIDKSIIDVKTYPIYRNLHVVDIKYPGISEKKYLITDNFNPEIEIISSDNLYAFSEFVVAFSDDISVDLDSFQVNVGGTILDYADSKSKNTVGKITYATFDAPQISRRGVEIVASIDDTSGNSAVSRKSVNLNGNIGKDITIDVIGATNLYGNRLIFSSFDDPVQMEIYSENGDDNLPIALDITSLNSKYISSYSIDDDNVIQLTLNLMTFANLSTSDGEMFFLELPVLIYDSSTSSFESYPFNFEILKLTPLVDTDKQIQVIDNRIDESLVVVKLFNSELDYSSLSVNSRTDSYFQIGDYVFISFDDVSFGTFKTLSYRDLSGNYHSFQISQDSSFTGSISFRDEGDYLSVYSTNDIPLEIDVLASARYSDDKNVLKQRQNQFFNPSFIEGTSIQTMSLFVPNDKRTLKSNILKNSQFTFENYPSVYISEGNIYYRGLPKFTTDLTSVVQGRVTGNEDIVFARANEKDCDLEERFFICYVDTNNYENIINMTFSDETGVVYNDTINITNENKTEPSVLALDLVKNQNVFFSSEGFTFSSGDLIFNFTPNIAGTHSLFINGNLIDTFEILDVNQIDLVLEQEDYEEDNENGAFLDVKVQDQTLIDSNTITLRFIRYLDAIVNIIVS